jgi:hypothetical protein
MPTHVELRIDVATSAEHAFNYFTAWHRQSEWMVGTRVEVRQPGPLGNGRGLGGEFAAWTGIGPLGFWDTMTITSWQENSRVDVLHTGKLVRGTGAMWVHPVTENTCVFVWEEDLDLPLGKVGEWGFAFVKPLFLWGIRVSLERFARAAQALAEETSKG